MKGGTVEQVAADIALTMSNDVALYRLTHENRRYEKMNRLRRVDPRGLEDTEDLIALHADLRALEVYGYDESGIPVPKWLAEKLKATAREITERGRAAKEMRLAKLKAKAEALKPDEVVLKETLDQIAALEKELA